MFISQYDQDENESEQQPTYNALTEDGDVLGLNSAVKTRKRRVMAKLNDERLLSARGIPYLRSNVIKSIRFKGKGHEKEDIARLLNSYQAWAHSLFPKANFDNFIVLARKVGSTPSFTRQRAEWLDRARRERAGEVFPAEDGVATTDTQATKSTSSAFDNLFLSDQEDSFPPPQDQIIVNKQDDDDLFVSDNEGPQITVHSDEQPLNENEEDLLEQFGL